MSLIRLFALVLALAPFGPAAAHEFWLSAERYQVAPGAAIEVHFRNGEKFEGNMLSYFDRSSTRFETVFEGEISAVEARSGDRPALQMTAPESDGLLVVLHETKASTLTYREWEKFRKFAAHKDFATAEADHLAAGWPREGFRESYTRHAKALIAVGSGAGADAHYGLATEFVAFSNPYEASFTLEMHVALFDGETPRGDAQVEVFERLADGSVNITLHRTDASGEARIPVERGAEYLFDAVILRPAPGAGSTDTAPLWESLWASLTFAVPD